MAAYVLRKPPSSERELIEQCIDKALQATDALLAGDMAKATTTIHAGAQRPKPPKLPRPAETQAAPTTEVAGKSSTPKEG